MRPPTGDAPLSAGKNQIANIQPATVETAGYQITDVRE